MSVIEVYMLLLPWSHACSAGFTLRGWRSQATGKPLLHFLHGNGFCGRTYAPMLQLLATDFDLWLCDVQGHGDSEHGGRFHGWNRSAELALEAFKLADELFGPVPKYALGHSFGGVLTALELARHPGLFRRAVLLDPVLFSPAMIGVMALSDVVGLYRRNTMASKARSRRQQWPSAQAAFDGLHQRGMFKGWTEPALWAYVEHALKPVPSGVELKCRPSREADIFGSYPKRLWSSLAKVQTPTQVIYGLRTYPFIASSVARWSALNAHVSAQTVAGGHCFMQEDPQDAAQRVAAFLLAQQ
jgi:pimeloyl-ACP methyl ester carboxylesterase